MKKILALTLALTMILSLAACGGETKKKLIVGTSADYAPYEFHTLIDGKDQIVGFDMELAKEIAKDLNMELEIKDMEFKMLLGELENGTIDMIIAGFSPDPERAVAYSDIYYKATQTVLVLKENENKYKDIESLAGKSVGAQTGSIQEGIVTEQMTQSTLISLAKIPNLVAELKGNKLEAVVMETPVAEGYLSQNPDLAMAFNVDEEEGGSAVAVKIGNEAILESVNKTIKRVNEDGSMERFVKEASELAEY